MLSLVCTALTPLNHMDVPPDTRHGYTDSYNYVRRKKIFVR